jgi:thiol-disulfide isomerase/thioredoxin
VTTTKRTSNRGRQTPAARKLPIMPILGGVFAVALIATILITFGGGSDALETGEPTIDGEALPVFTDAASDAAVGLPIPGVSGADFAGNPVTIADDGRPKAIVFLAHWCPHCQAEVPEVQGLVDAGLIPPEIDLYSVATAISSTQENYPPSEWLEREGWSSPVIVDDAGSSVARTFGLSAYPYWVFVDADGEVKGRTTGRAGADRVLAFFTQLALESAD